MLPLFVLLFIGLPVLELYVIIQVGQAIGIVPTLALLVLDSFVGAALARSQGRAVWRRFNLALAEGRIPARETFDGAMVILGGALMISPGFVTDAFALLLLFPPTRAALRRLLTAAVMRRGRIVFTVGGIGSRPGDPFPPRDAGFPPRESGYDYEGTAREVRDDEELPPGGERG
ncbi:MAG TPA: FxsA family protein [Solirubrobacterales bacterium]|jgi:UPF0716 protein FxsA